MAGVRKALIVATDQYTDPKLTQLNAPAEDARALAEVLQNPDVGAYEVQTVLNGTCQEVEIAVATFFQSGARDDTLLVHFSCHGVKDLSGELYFATSDTKLPLLKVTAVSSAMVKQAMEESRASLILCLVDCCYSGAFTKSTKAAATVDLTERLGGRGRAVITASTSLQLALDGQQEASLFTHAVVEGLRSGEADRDLDGLVTLDEFYNYIHEKVTEKNPDQTPVKSFDVQGEVYVARRGAPITTAAPLPRELVDTLATGEDWQRLGAVSRLTDLLNAGHPGRALGARQALEKVRDNDDSIRVRKAAEAALEGAGDTEAIPLIPQYVESVPVAENFEDFETAGAKSATTTVEQAPAADTVTDVPPVEQTPAADTVTDVPPVEQTPAADTATGAPTGETGTGHGPTSLAGGLASDTVTDVPVIPGGGGGGTVLPPTPEPDSRWKKFLIIGSLAVVGIFAMFFVIGLLVGDDDGGGGAGSEDPTTPAGVEPLPDSVLVVPFKQDGVRSLIAVDVGSHETATLIRDADVPTIGAGRDYLTFLRTISDGSSFTNRVAFAASVDGTGEGITFHDNALADCPTQSRLSLSSDGQFAAFVCKDPSPDGVSGASRGLWHALADEDGVDGDEMELLVADSNVSEAPTWTDDNNLIYVLKNQGPSGESILVQTPTSSDEREPLTFGVEGWDTNPDWSDEGVLFLRAQAAGEPGDVFVLKDERVTQLTFTDDVLYPTWSPDASQFAFVRINRETGVKSLWVQDNDPDAQAEYLEVRGLVGPPAWGPR